MLTLHLSDYLGQFALWAETDRPTDHAATDYPFQVSRETLLAALAALGFQQPQELEQARVWIWAPSHEGHFFSSGLPLPEGLGLAPRELMVLLPQPAQVVEWLASRPLVPGLDLAPELKLWHQLLRLADSLIARGRMLPGLVHESDGWRARWEPLLAAEDHIQLGRLAQALPGSVRSLTPPESEAPQTRPQELLLAALIQLTDALVRRRPLGPEPGSLPLPDLPLPERWLQALRRRHGGLQGSDVEFERLARQLSQWVGKLQQRANAPFQLVLQLEEPSETSDGWYLRPLLRPLDDPSLYLPLEYVWAPSEQQPEVIRSRARAVQAFVHQTLEEAAGLCPALREVASARFPLGQELDLTAVRAFLDAAEALEASGCGLRLPAWWLRGRAKLKAKASFTPPPFQTDQGLSLNTILQADWKLMLGDMPLSIEDLRELASLKSDLVQWQGQWLLVEPDTLRAARRFFARQQPGTATLQEVLALDAEAAPFEIEELVTADWLQDLLARLHSGETPDVPVPASFCGQLRPYQERGLSWLSFLCGHGLGACLADDMGLGKTVQTLALIQHLRDQGQQGPILLVCPTSLLSNWVWEAEHFTPQLKVHIHHGNKRDKDEAFLELLSRQDILITSYSLLARDKDFLLPIAWAGVILDEAQNIKNPETQQARVARALPSRWRIALTGTPVENHVGDLWALMDFLNPRLLGNRQSFQESFLTPIQRWQDKEALARLKRLVSPFVLRRLKSDKSIVAELPDKLEMKVHCTLTREQASLYLAVLRDLEHALEHVSGIERRGLILASLTRLKQICNHPAQYLGERSRLGGRSGKLMRLKEMVEEILEMDEKSLIFTQYAEMGKLLQRYL
ncbi:MAG: DEAD/DEAH box helicase, partial [Candidatus Sericytochromatia bacterium]